MKVKLQVGSESVEVQSLAQDREKISFVLAGEKYEFAWAGEGEKVLLTDGMGKSELVLAPGSRPGELHLARHGQMLAVARAGSGARRGGAGMEGQLTSPMPGKILKYLVTSGEAVVPGQPVVIMEAMKMEHTLKSPVKGVVEKLLFKDGEQVKDGMELLQIKEERA